MAISGVSAAVLCGICVGSAAAGPAMYYASPTSTDTTGSCSSSAPCELDHAVSLASAGDVIVVLPGTYSVTSGIEVSLPVTIEGAPGEPRPSLLGAPSLTSDTLEASGGATIRHLEIETQNDTGAQTTALSVDGATAEDLVLVAGPHDVQGEALSVSDSAAGTVVRTVLARAQGANSEAVSFHDSKTAPGTASVYSLTAIGEGSATTAISGNVATGKVSLKDSIADGQGEDISTKPGTKPISVSYSDFRPQTSSGYVDGGGNLGTPPMFVNPGSEDFHEASAALTIDAGAFDPALTSTDLDGNPRFMGPAPDMGAYEYQGAAGLPPVSAPAAGMSVTLRRSSGEVLVELPSTQHFRRLSSASSVPVGSIVDVTNGRVLLASAVNRAGATKAGSFHGSQFVVTQTPGARLMTDLRLVGGSFAGCPALAASADSRTPIAAIARLSRRHRLVRQLWGSDNGGSFQTIGNTASAAVRGTVWLTQDRCDGTLIRVQRGRVLVHDDVLRGNVLVGAGHSYFARARF